MRLSREKRAFYAFCTEVDRRMAARIPPSINKMDYFNFRGRHAGAIHQAKVAAYAEVCARQAQMRPPTEPAPEATLEPVPEPAVEPVELPTTRPVTVRARYRDINARGRGYDEYVLIGLPGADRLIWADQVVGAEVHADDYPRSRGIRSSERHGAQWVRFDALPVGAVIVEITKHTDGTTQRAGWVVAATGGEVTKAGFVSYATLPDAAVTNKRDAGGGWVTKVVIPAGIPGVVAGPRLFH